MAGNNETIISPPFTDSNWYLSDTCSLISRGEYSCSFTTTIVESGISFKIPTSWYGKTITISFNISNNACVRIQNSDTWQNICELSSDNSPFTLVVPDAENHSNMVLAIISPTVANTTISINSFKITTDELVRNMIIPGLNIASLFIGDVEIKKIYLKDTLIYENIKIIEVKDTLYCKVTSTLFILKEDALKYDKENLTLEINDDIIDIEYIEEDSNLTIGGEK